MEREYWIYIHQAARNTALKQMQMLLPVWERAAVCDHVRHKFMKWEYENVVCAASRAAPRWPRNLLSPVPPRCPTMTGGVTPAMGRMTRSPVVGCGAAATLKPWGTRRAESRTPAPRHRLRSWCGLTPWSRPSSDPGTCWTPRGTPHDTLVSMIQHEQSSDQQCLQSAYMFLSVPHWDFDLTTEGPKDKRFKMLWLCSGFK